MRIDRRTAFKLFGATASYAFLGAPMLNFAHAAGGTLTVALDELPKQLDPLLYQTNPGYRTMQNIYDTLLTVDYGGEGALKPALAESWGLCRKLSRSRRSAYHLTDFRRRLPRIAPSGLASG